MRFMWPCGGSMDDLPKSIGCFTQPLTGVTQGIREGRYFAIDNGCYNKPFNGERFFKFLKRLEPYKDNCLFVVVPDMVGDAKKTIALWRKWAGDIRFDGWPLAFVAQDGQEDCAIPSGASALFVGGSTEWKISHHAANVIRQAQSRGLHVHIGRVNWFKRYALFAGLKGASRFTCDGTRPIRDDKEKTKRDWLDYMSRPLQARMI